MDGIWVGETPTCVPRDCSTFYCAADEYCIMDDGKALCQAGMLGYYNYTQYIQAFHYVLKQVIHIMEPGCGLATPGLNVYIPLHNTEI